MEPNHLTDEFEERDLAEVPAWEEIAAGRYMPRRIRGSFRGRVLG